MDSGECSCAYAQMYPNVCENTFQALHKSLYICVCICVCTHGVYKGLMCLLMLVQVHVQLK